MVQDFNYEEARACHDWFKRNKLAYFPGKRVAFDTPGSYEETSKDAIQVSAAELVDWLPVDEWIIRERALGKCGDGSAEQQRQLAIASFENALMEKEVPKKRSQDGKNWLLGIYKGQRASIAKVEERSSGWKRRKVVGDTVVCSLQ